MYCSLGTSSLVLELPSRTAALAVRHLPSALVMQVRQGAARGDRRWSLASRALRSGGIPPEVRVFSLSADKVLELGSSVGYYTVQGARAAPGVEYVAVEPHPESIETCRANLELNQVRNVRLINAAAVAHTDGGATDLVVPQTQLGHPTVAFLRAAHTCKPLPDQRRDSHPGPHDGCNGCAEPELVDAERPGQSRCGRIRPITAARGTSPGRPIVASDAAASRHHQPAHHPVAGELDVVAVPHLIERLGRSG
jgi:hypothetical protein